MNHYKTTITSFNEEYNIVKIHKKDLIDVYLEKVDYGNLYYMISIRNDIPLDDGYIREFIIFAECDNFWGDN